MQSQHEEVKKAYEAAAFRTSGPIVDNPQLNLRVLIVGNCFRGGAVSMFARAGCVAATGIEDAELVVFLGGEDVDPDLYGEKPLRTTYFNRARDEVEMDIFVEAQRREIPCFGICRGMQFLHVMNGGQLYQHVGRHTGSDHNMTDLRTGEIISVSSMHHQMCREDDTCFPLAYATQPGQSGTYQAYNYELSSDKHNDLEAAVYPAINALAVQGHPEVPGTPRFTAWCIERIGEWIDGRMDGMGDNYVALKSYVNQ